MNCIALDDEPLALQLLGDYIRLYPGLAPLGFFTNPELALERLKPGGIDLLFLDIEMPEISGIAFLKQLKNPPMVIFTTAHPGFAVEGFNLSAIDYLLKPFDFERFVKAVKKAHDWKNALSQPDPKQYLLVKSGYADIPVLLSKITHLEGFDDYVKIHIEDQSKPMLTLSSLKSLIEKLPENQFMRVHRSYVVALNKIVAIRRNQLTLTGDMNVPVGDTYVAAVRKVTMNFKR